MFKIIDEDECALGEFGERRFILKVVLSLVNDPPARKVDNLLHVLSPWRNSHLKTKLFYSRL